MCKIFSEINSIKEEINSSKKEGLIIGFVPTMGAIHAGHESLMQKARSECDKVVVSIFVNPVQFGPDEDFDKYPRQSENDIRICERNNVDIVFIPDIKEMYPEGKESLTKITIPDTFQNILCGKTRPGHFNGVATVVLKLFNIISPDKAYFGQKDAQQLIIIKKTVRDLNLPVEIVGCPTIRDKDGLALSSRNVCLSNDERKKAVTIFGMLKKIESDRKSGINLTSQLIDNALPLLHPDVKLEYFEAVDMNTLKRTDVLQKDTLIAVAAKIGNVRLIDNLMILD